MASTYTTATCNVATTHSHAFTTRAVIQYSQRQFSYHSCSNYSQATTELYKDLLVNIYYRALASTYLLTGITTQVVTREHNYSPVEPRYLKQRPQCHVKMIKSLILLCL